MLVEGHSLWGAQAESRPLVASGPSLAGLCMWVDSGEGQQEGVRDQEPTFTLFLGQVLSLRSSLLSFPRMSYPPPSPPNTPCECDITAPIAISAGLGLSPASWPRLRERTKGCDTSLSHKPKS